MLRFTTWIRCPGHQSRPHGKKLYFYGAGFEIEVYDAVTLKYERTWDLNNDVTSAGMIVIN